MVSPRFWLVDVGNQIHTRARAGSQIRAIFRTLSGLRVSEISALKLREVVLTETRPHIIVSNGKGGKRRKVPLWLDRQTLSEIAAWKAVRDSQWADPDCPFVCNLRKGESGQPLGVRALQHRFKTILRTYLAPDRVEQLSIHSGRHSFASHLLKRGFSLVQVRDWLGHSSIATTSVYLHTDPDEGSEVLEAFAF
ncbi:site-specific integrase [Bremerella cremea]|uniref:Site-specific integrase n=1 Tax=Bremerella cremea TaxID=1031537 RepID=A0A368KSQ1_9BACT|nr:site-specific integrase [Bremerella cremea]